VTTATDSFTRANNSGDLGTNWTTVPGETLIELLSNQAANHGDSADQAEYWNVFTPTNDQYSKSKLTAVAGYTTGDGPGEAVRMSTSAVTYYRLVCCHQASSNVMLSKKIAGAFTALATVTQAWTDGDTWELRVVGTSLTAYLNGTIVSGLTTTDTSITSGRVGLAYSSENAGKTATWDDWDGGDYGASGAQTVNPNAIATGEALFQPTVKLQVLPDAIASGENVFQPTLPSTQTVQPNPVATGENVFQPTAKLSVSAGAIATGESVLQPTVKLQVLVNAIATAEQVYGPIVTLSGSPLSVLPNTITSLEAVYAPALGQQVVAGTITSAEQVFSPSVAVVTPQTVQPGTIATAEQVYAPAFVGLVTPGVFPDDIPSAARVYAPTVAFVPRPPPPALVRVAPVRAPALASAPHSAAPAFGSAARRTGAPPLRVGP